MSVVCEVAAPFIANSAVEGKETVKLFRGHESTCLKCQARHASMSRTARELAALEGQGSVAPAELEWRVMTSLQDDLAIKRGWTTPIAWLGAALSMAAAVLIWRLRPGPG
jgi:hypothetical protein